MLSILRDINDYTITDIIVNCTKMNFVINSVACRRNAPPYQSCCFIALYCEQRGFGPRENGNSIEVEEVGRIRIERRDGYIQVVRVVALGRRVVSATPSLQFKEHERSIKMFKSFSLRPPKVM